MRGLEEKRAYAMYISSLLIVGSIGVVRRFIPLSSALLALVRGALGAASLALFVKLRGRRLFHGLGRKRTLLLCLTGAAIGVNWVLLFEAFRHTSVAVATLCYYFQPTIVLLLSPLLLRERLTGKKLLCAALAVTGMVLVSGVAGEGRLPPGQLKGVLFALGAAVFYAAVVLLNKLQRGLDAYEKTVIQLASAAVAILPYVLLTEDLSALRPDGRTLALLLVVGVVYTGLCYALYFGSMDALRAQTIAILSYLDPVVALLCSALILHEGLSGAGLLGAALILGAAVLSEWESGKTETITEGER